MSCFPFPAVDMVAECVVDRGGCFRAKPDPTCF
jgi:hypothetical protein